MSKIKHNYKLPKEAKLEIIEMINRLRSNKEIINRISGKYSVSLSDGYISQLRKKANLRQIAFESGNIEKLMERKSMINSDMLEILQKSYRLIKKHLSEIKSINDFRELSVISRMVISIHKTYLDIHGNFGEKDGVDYNIGKAME